MNLCSKCGSPTNDSRVQPRIGMKSVQVKAKTNDTTFDISNPDAPSVIPQDSSTLGFRRSFHVSRAQEKQQIQQQAHQHPKQFQRTAHNITLQNQNQRKQHKSVHGVPRHDHYANTRPPVHGEKHLQDY